MVYVARDGTVGGRKSIGQAVSDFIKAIYEFIMLFFHTIMNPPSIENAQSQVSGPILFRRFFQSSVSLVYGF